MGRPQDDQQGSPATGYINSAAETSSVDDGVSTDLNGAVVNHEVSEERMRKTNVAASNNNKGVASFTLSVSSTIEDLQHHQSDPKGLNNGDVKAGAGGKDSSAAPGSTNKCNLLYGLEDKPPLHLSMLLGLQVI